MRVPESRAMTSGLHLLVLFVGLHGLHADSSKSGSSTGEEEASPSATGHDLRFLWLSETDTYFCCNGGSPEALGAVRNFSATPVPEAELGGREGGGDATSLNCRQFRVSYLARRARMLSDAEDELEESPVRVRCACPALGRSTVLDEHCRRLPACKNSGVRAANHHRCICPAPFFGELCEKYCDQGQRVVGHNGREYCSCVPYYQGEECRNLLCLNGGREDNGRCICPHQFLGYHCEIDTNRTGVASGSRFQRFGDQSAEMFTRDISGTIFSLIMIVVLVVSMYLLMKHRMQTRYLNRRPDLLSACNFPVPATMAVASGQGPGCLGSSRRADYVVNEDARIYSFRPIIAALPDNGPPPYLPVGHRGRRGRNDVLPPLPSYEDATKLPPLRQNIGGDEPAEDAAASPARSLSPDPAGPPAAAPSAEAAPASPAASPPASPAPARDSDSASLSSSGSGSTSKND